MVRKAGLEPARLAALEPKSSASTSSATFAWMCVAACKTERFYSKKGTRFRAARRFFLLIRAKAGLSSRDAPVKLRAMTPDEYCQQKALCTGSSFYYSILFLKPPRRNAMIALQALYAELREVAASNIDENAARIKLAWWRTEIAALYRGDPQHLVTRALARGLAQYGIAQKCLDDIVDGMEMDLLQTRYLDFIALERYIALTAGAAAECRVKICGAGSGPGPAYAQQLGQALALSNLLRSIGTDARRGYVYLPVNELQQFGVPVADILNARYSENFTRLMQFQYARAHACFESGFESALSALPKADRQAQRPNQAMATIARALLEEIRADGFRVLHQRTSLTPIRKLWLASKTHWGMHRCR